MFTQGDLSRYGPGTGAFLLPVYGGGELPQAFCRVAAVTGALYVLRQGIKEFLVDPGSGLCSALVTSSGQAGHLCFHPHLLYITPMVCVCSECSGSG